MTLFLPPLKVKERCHAATPSCAVGCALVVGIVAAGSASEAAGEGRRMTIVAAICFAVLYVAIVVLIVATYRVWKSGEWRR